MFYTKSRGESPYSNWPCFFLPVIFSNFFHKMFFEIRNIATPRQCLRLALTGKFMKCLNCSTKFSRKILRINKVMKTIRKNWWKGTSLDWVARVTTDKNASFLNIFKLKLDFQVSQTSSNYAQIKFDKTKFFKTPI